MIKFEIGNEYETSSVCNSNCKFRIKVVKRTDKTVTFEYDGKTLRRKLKDDGEIEYFKLENYSMAPIFDANDLVKHIEELADPVVDDCFEKLVEDFKIIDRKAFINILIKYGCNKHEVLENAFNINKLVEMYIDACKSNMETFYYLTSELMRYIK